MANEKDLDEFFNKQREFTAAEVEKEKEAMIKQGVGAHSDSELPKDESIVKDEKIKEKQLHWRGGWGWGGSGGWGWGWNGFGGWRAPGFWYGGPSYYGWNNGWWGYRGWW